MHPKTCPGTCPVTPANASMGWKEFMLALAVDAAEALSGKIASRVAITGAATTARLQVKKVG